MQIPYNFEPRDYQLPLLKAMDSGYKRAFCVWHRRAGKDKTLINLVVKKMLERKGTYYYFFPTYSQGKKVIWDGVGRDGFSFIDHFPQRIIKSKNGTELKIELFNGSVFQIIGTDKYDSVRGTNPVGCVFSEYAFHNPAAWEVIRPILSENGGWAVFNTTPNGKNHAYELYEMAKNNPEWFCEKLSITDTNAINESIVQEERNSGMHEEMIQQEYYCSFDIGALGSVYGREMSQAWKDEKICELPFYLEKQVDVHFDIGVSKGNETAMWFSQSDGNLFNFINYYEASGRFFDHFATYIEEYIQQKGGKLGTIYIPHDSKKRDWVTGSTAIKAFKDRFGEHKVVILKPDSPTDTDGLQRARSMIPRCRFDKENCKQGIKCLENYKYEYDQIKKVFRSVPLHDWSSNGADAFRYFAKSVKDEEGQQEDYTSKIAEARRQRENIRSVPKFY